jgi:hypothetical protein
VSRSAISDLTKLSGQSNADPEPIRTPALIKVKLGEFSPSSDRNLAGIEIVIHPEGAPRPPHTNETSYCKERIRSMLAFIILQSSDPERETFLVANLLIFITAFLATWSPSLAARRWVFKEPAQRWVGLLIAFLTFLLGMAVGSSLTEADRPGIYGAAAVCAYFTVTGKGTAEN